MNAPKLVAIAALVGLAFISIPSDASPTGTASANVCTPYLVDGDVKSYTRCTQQQCQWNDFPYGHPVCTD